jgi:hypothetical protein
MIKTGPAVVVALAVLALVPSIAGRAADPEPALNPVMKKLSTLVGGRWETPAPDGKTPPFVRTKWEWTSDHQALASSGVLGQGTEHPVRGEARLGWDPAAKQVYYLDSHGTQLVYFGHVHLEGETMVYQFKTIVGPPSEWVAREVFEDPNTLKAEMTPVKDGKPAGGSISLLLKRVGNP